MRIEVASLEGSRVSVVISSGTYGKARVRGRQQNPFEVMRSNCCGKNLSAFVSPHSECLAVNSNT